LPAILLNSGREQRTSLMAKPGQNFRLTRVEYLHGDLQELPTCH
jgi:hypothetical protein